MLKDDLRMGIKVAKSMAAMHMARIRLAHGAALRKPEEAPQMMAHALKCRAQYEKCMDDAWWMEEGLE